ALTLAVGSRSPLVKAEEKKKKLVMIAGTPSHGPGDHEFNAGVRLLEKCLKDFPKLETVVFLSGYPKDDSALDTADAILCYADGGTNHPLVREKHLERVGKLMARGVGLMCAHYGVEVPKDLGGPGCGFTGGHFHRNWKDDNFRKVVLNALVWLCKLEVPKDGVRSDVTEDDIKANLDPKGKK